jgi:hypothetical protein
MIFRVGLTVTPILIGVFILSQGSAASDFILAAILIVGGLLTGALFWWDARRRQGDDEMARVGCTCSWNSGVRTQVDLACPSHGEGSG